ncbi:[protein-PII] uridylyltransferase [Candidatus Parabeggiatoa sp. HSG14]|uniref:[protein-PII] uridylyltransferase n=1 Tax=Candidatus Parabeggiatoa sp. HSG14 TaxID=3055593 RepID=UPI0025A6DBC2|nr:[protein-PII] uridylyltransferase [Thiotrichales bacterium HSG14]
MYATNYIDIELFNSQQFENALNTDDSELNVFRNALKQGHDILKERFQKRKNATDYVNQRTWLVDQILIEAWQQMCIRTVQKTVALVAVGGYGRGELHPYSDIDLLVLLESPLDAEKQKCIENLIMFLWDIRLEVGHSVRTIAECEQEAAADISVATNLMEARLLTGQESLFQAMQTVVAPTQIWHHKDFFAAKLEEQTQRHLKYDDTVYKLEPNIKEGPGGLRDIQTIGWVAKRHSDAETLHDLVQHGFLTETEYQRLIEGQEFLWKIRCFLHLVAGRREERLLFDFQRTLAVAFGYQDDNKGLGVEKLMKRYYRTVLEISTLNSVLLQLFQEAILYADIPTTVRPLNKRFQVRNDFIEVTHDKVFVNYPFALLEIFLLMQQNPEIKGLRASTIRLILYYNYLIDEAFRRDLRSRSLFIEIFRQPEGLTHTLWRMNHYGILATYIPSFGKIVGQMQYDLFHIYTVDQHSFFVVRNLRRLTLPEFYHELPFCSKLIQTIPKPELLHIAGLFHDIAKGRGGDHSKLGEVETLDFCQRHCLSDNDARLVAWLVRNHLLMSTTIQRQDISEPEVIKIFAQRVGDCVHLDYLYLLTIADIRATNPKLWNTWKDALLTELYHKANAVLHHGKENVLDKKFHIHKIQKEARHLLNEPTDERITALWKMLGDDYFLDSMPKDIANETQVFLNHASLDDPLVLERHAIKGGFEFIMFYTKARDNLFAEISYFLEQQNLTIVNAYIIPTDSEYTISSYTLLEENGMEINHRERVDFVLQGVKQILDKDISTSFCPITRLMPRQLKHFSMPTRVTFTQEPGNNHTIMEVITTDRPGVLSRIAQALETCKIRVKKAKIATLGSRIEDIFFITDYENHALYSAKKLDDLSKKLSDLLDKDVPMIQDVLTI